MWRTALAISLAFNTPLEMPMDAGFYVKSVEGAVLSILHWRCARRHFRCGPNRSSHLFQYSIGDAPPSWRRLHPAPPARTFNTPLEMHIKINEQVKIVGVYVLSILHWRCATALQTLIESAYVYFQYSIGDAFATGAFVSRLPVESFNTPLEMRKGLSYSKCVSTAWFFQYSIGDAARRLSGRCRQPTSRSLSILHWRCCAIASYAAAMVIARFFQYSIGDAINQSPHACGGVSAGFQYSIGDAMFSTAESQQLC